MFIEIEPNSFLFKLTIATFLCIIIGLERELKRKPLGLKTCLVIGIMSCLLTHVSIIAAEHYAIAYTKPMDPLRLAAQIVSGIGFLGAGVILRRNNDMISGLTTAAMIWGAGGIGIACGAGFWIEAIVATVLLLISVEFLPFLFKFIGPKALREKELKVKITVHAGDQLTEILKDMKSQNMKAKKVRVKDLKDTTIRQMDLIILVDEKTYTTDIYYNLKKMDYIESVEIESL
ncbi:MgtC/SapB family protein [Halalkalibacter akibai]|uniref:Peptide transport system permease protein SapB n=1 Tax=Halalkalibacter akibai (strain ATCC 43226 / DSM 21942 / CIP 109018 / JCM 9157 / 1139) TaxID=1236973 RepID=W4QRL7_HALA3|nr:MgtC/SapB family protein [Halalkalibacter akibai]GAE34293.1 peptide transport system permease protein SapB [Halalkalibacter akibai JCM 9157]